MPTTSDIRRRVADRRRQPVAVPWQHVWTATLAAICVLTAAGAATRYLPVAAEEEESARSCVQPPPADVDLGLFARVVTSDPERSDGARTSRLEEFRADDVFLTTELATEPDGSYRVPTHPASGAAIGLEWAERRVLRSLTLEPLTPRPDTVTPVLEYWSSSGREDSWGSIGQTPWQGRWEPVPVAVEVHSDRWSATIPPAVIPELRTAVGVLKIRWRFPATDDPIIVRRPQALGAATWRTDLLRLETETPADVTVQVYNGLLANAETGQCAQTQTGTTNVPWPLTVVSSQPSPNKADRTLLRVQLPSGLVTVAVEDVLSAGQVYVRDVGLLVCRAESSVNLAKHRARIFQEKTLLAQVREMPDQSLGQALHSLWRPVQNNGPTMLSLACDNAKFIVDREGGLRYGPLSFKPRFPLTTITVARLDFGLLGVDTCVRPSATTPGLPLRIAEQTYAKGLGLHAHAELIVTLDGKFDTFAADVGVLPSGQPGGTVVCLVDVDGQRRFDSGVLRQGEAPRPVELAVAGARQLVLRVTDAGDGILNDAANWTQARLVPTGSHEDAPVFLSDLCVSQEWARVNRQRTLEERWLPIIINAYESGGIRLRQRTWVAPQDETHASWERVGRTRSVGVMEFVVENNSDTASDVELCLDASYVPATPADQPLEARTIDKRILWTCGDQLRAVLDAAGAAPLSVVPDSAGVRISGRLPAHASSRLAVFVPAWPAGVEEQAALDSPDELARRTARYWQELIGSAMQIRVPEPLLEDVYRATQVHCLMAARNEADGARIAPWIASDAYGPLDTEAQAVILGMDLVGHGEFAQRSLDFFIASYNSDGLLAKGYTLMGTGQHLWTLAAHHALARDHQWVARIAPEILKSGRWIVRQTEKTKRLDARGERVPEYGLAPPGVLADWERFAYYFYANAHYCAGLDGAAQVLAEAMPQEAAELRQAADAYRDDLLRAFRRQRSMMPVVPLRDGTWVPPCPSSLYCYGLTREFFGGISAIGHDVEAGGNHLIPLRLLPPDSPEADAIVDYLEDRWFLIDGIFDAYPAGENEADWFNRGGFAKLQPHYARTTDIHALRDDVRPFIRTYFNTLPVLLNRENLTFWEHMNNGGAWNKTHESAWFLQNTRTMLLAERGDELWLAPFVTTHWMQDGMCVSVERAPTRFGTAGYTLQSAVGKGYIDAVIQSPTERPPTQIVLRVRHPDNQKIRSVSVNGRPHADFDAAAQLIRLTPSAEPIAVRITY